MRQVLFVQGAGKDVHDGWDNRLVASLETDLGHSVRYPLMPDEAEPSFRRWAAALETEFASLGDGSVLIGHSVGGAVLVNALALQPPKFRPGGVFLISAPYIGDGGWPSDEFTPVADLRAALPPEVPIHLYHGEADETVPVAHLDLYAAAIPQAKVRRLAGRDHQLNDDLGELARDILALG